MPLNNNPPKDAEDYLAELDAIAPDAARWIGAQIDEEHASALRDLIGKIDGIAKSAEKDRKQIKEPYLDQGRKIDAAFKPVAERADKLIAPLKAMITKWLQAEEARKHAEAERARKEAEEKARLAEVLKDDDTFGERVADMAKEAQQAADQAKRLAEHNAVKGAESDRALGLRTYRKAKIINGAMLVGHFANHADVLAVCEKLANAAIRSGVGDNIPGIEIIEEKRVA